MPAIIGSHRDLEAVAVLLQLPGVPLIATGQVGDGNEMVTNGTFNTDIAGWDKSTAASATQSWNAGQYLDSTSIQGEYLGNYNAIPFVNGDTYVVKYNVLSTNNSTQLRVGHGNIISSTSYFNIALGVQSGLGKNTRMHTATIDDGYLYIGGRDDVNQLSIDDISVQKATQGLLLDDGAGNQLTAPLSAGRHSIKVELSPSSMSLTVDNVFYGISDYTPILAGIITAAEDMYALRTAV